LFLLLQKRTARADSVNISWGGAVCLVMVPLILLHCKTNGNYQTCLYRSLRVKGLSSGPTAIAICPSSVNISWGGAVCLVMVPLILLHSGNKAPTQSLLGQD
jgi:steroid 5-alpha reductase family enzyme